MLTPLATVILTAYVAQYGQEAVAAYGVGGRLESMACLFILSLSMSLPPFISQNSGARQLGRVDEAYRCAVRMVLVIQLVMYLLLALGSAWLAPAFSQDDGVQRLLMLYLWILPLGYGLQGVTILTNSALNALHQPRQAFGLSMLRFFVLFVPISCLLGYGFGLAGLFVGGVVANLLCACLAYLWFNSTLCRLSLESP